jgi:hypothetical protein
MYSSDVTFGMAAADLHRKVPLLTTAGAAGEITEQGGDHMFRSLRTHLVRWQKEALEKVCP